jgi:hypothetical protein
METEFPAFSLIQELRSKFRPLLKLKTPSYSDLSEPIEYLNDIISEDRTQLQLPIYNFIVLLFNSRVTQLFLRI